MASLEKSDELWELVRMIPKGKCSTYGDLGAALSKPISGFLVGRQMAHAPEGVPWWRVISKNGNLPIIKMDIRLEIQQRYLLEQEGVPFIGDAVNLHLCRFSPI